MKALRELLHDRRRAQRGSVLSAALIMVAFLAIVSGALMTALSTNFLLSTDLVNRINAEAAVNSATELGINRLQRAPSLNSACPTPVVTPTLNGLTAVATVAHCAAVVDRRSPNSLLPIATTEPFQIDGTHAVLPGLDDYVVMDADGSVFDFPFGSSLPRWNLTLGGTSTAPPAVMPDPNNNGQFFDLLPLAGSACPASGYCVSVRSDDGSSSAPAVQCTLQTAAAVNTQPAAARNIPDVAFIADAGGNLYAIDVTSSGQCEVEDQISAHAPIVAGPMVYPCATSCGGRPSDDILVITSDAVSSHLASFSFTTNKALGRGPSIPLPWAGASGLAAEWTALPSRLAISFSGGQMAMVQLDARGAMTLTRKATLAGGIADNPFWCHCPGSVNLIGLGADNGTLFVLDTNLAIDTTYATGHPIHTSPTTDAMGDWYFGADDGQLYEVQDRGNPAMAPVASYGTAGGPDPGPPAGGGGPAGRFV